MITGESVNISEFSIQTGQILGSPVYWLYNRRPGPCVLSYIQFVLLEM